MRPSPSLYAPSPALALRDPWLRAHVPTLDDVVRRRFIQLVTGIFAQCSLLLEKIAEASVFTATEVRNATHVRRSMQDERLTLQAVYDPFLRRARPITW